MAKQARERAVRERRALKLERKREAAHLRLAGDAEGGDSPADGAPEAGLHLVTEPAGAAAGDRQEDGGARGSDA